MNKPMPSWIKSYLPVGQIAVNNRVQFPGDPLWRRVDDITINVPVVSIVFDPHPEWVRGPMILDAGLKLLVHHPDPDGELLDVWHAATRSRGWSASRDTLRGHLSVLRKAGITVIMDGGS